MSEWLDDHCTCEQIFMYACFVLAIVSSSVAPIAFYVDGVDSLHSWSIAGVGLAASSVWSALGISLNQDRKRKDADESIKDQLDNILVEVRKRECKCQAECRSEVVTQEDRGRSWLFGLLCSSALR